jgi:hypothetical protein
MILARNTEEEKDADNAVLPPSPTLAGMSNEHIGLDCRQ